MTKDELRDYLFWQKELPINLKNSLDATHLIAMYFNKEKSEQLICGNCDKYSDCKDLLEESAPACEIFSSRYN